MTHPTREIDNAASPRPVDVSEMLLPAAVFGVVGAVGFVAFEVVNDPSEAFDLIGHKPELAKRMHGRLESWWAALPKHTPSSRAVEFEPVDKKTLEKLRAIGYVE